MTAGEIYTSEYNLIPKTKCYYGYDIADRFCDIIEKYEFDKIFVIAEDTVYKIYGFDIVRALDERNINYFENILEISEQKKKLSTVDYLCNWLISQRVTKDSIIISFGGGLIGNVAGLVASLIYRGIRYIEIPTTFLGMTDSTLSNKQAVNGDNGKNQLGTFYAPLFVWTDLKYVETENKKHFSAALIEGVKNAFIQEMGILDDFRHCFREIDVLNRECLMKLFETITQSKNRILQKDPTEKKYSVVLEYGHTFGHAMEFLSEGGLIHGQAVAIGMCIAAEISLLLGKLSEDEKELHYTILGELGLYSEYNTAQIKKMTPTMIMESIEYDNKRTSKGVRYVILNKLGECDSLDGEWEIPVDKETVTAAIDKAFDRILKC